MLYILESSVDSSDLVPVDIVLLRSVGRYYCSVSGVVVTTHIIIIFAIFLHSSLYLLSPDQKRSVELCVFSLLFLYIGLHWERVVVKCIARGLLSHSHARYIIGQGYSLIIRNRYLFTRRYHPKPQS